MTVTALDTKRHRLGGSTIAAAAGISPWCSRVELFYRMTGVLPEPEGEAMWWGTRVQPLIFSRLLEEYGRDVREAPDLGLIREECPWLVGHPDGLEGEWDAIVEAKLTGSRSYDPESLPIDWQAQVQTYMHLAECDRAIVAVLAAGTRLDVHEVAYDERAALRLIQLGEEFMDYLARDEPPPPDGSDSARKTLGYVFPEQTPGRLYRLLGDEWDAFKQLREWREAEAKCKARVQEIENVLKAAAGDAETLIGPHDEEVVTWKAQTSRRIDTKRLRAEHPEIAAAYETETPTRVWRMR